MFACLLSCLSVCLFACLSACLPACLPISLSACLLCLWICLCVYLSVCLYICLPVVCLSMFDCLYICLSCLSLCLPVCLSTCTPRTGLALRYAEQGQNSSGDPESLWRIQPPGLYTVWDTDFVQFYIFRITGNYYIHKVCRYCWNEIPAIFSIKWETYL
jgi:hypothetical protein